MMVTDQGPLGRISIQSYPFNLNACSAAVNYIKSDNILAKACSGAAMRYGAAVRHVKNGPKLYKLMMSL
jgi:hypothetical protein